MILEFKNCKKSYSFESWQQEMETNFIQHFNNYSKKASDEFHNDQKHVYYGPGSVFPLKDILPYENHKPTHEEPFVYIIHSTDKRKHLVPISNIEKAIKKPLAKI